jgi:glycosyltransferase involved in cell wall biosynthesis
MKIALVHDYLIDYGGAERVVEALHEIFPDAPLYTSFVHEKALGIHWSRFKDWDIRQSWLSKIPLHQKLFSPLRIFAPNYFQAFDLSKYDVVLSSSNAYFAKAVRVRKDAVHICYCHTPARSLYGYTTMMDWKKNPVFHFFGTLINHYLRVEDVKIAQDVDYFIANSEEVKKRIQKFYRKDSTIIYPPVDIPEHAPAKKKGQYFLYVGRIAKSKNVDLAVAACTKLGLPLKVVGEGKGLGYLKELAGPSVEFIGAVNDAQLHALYEEATCLLFPAIDEDFGIVPVEAMGHGVPVIAHRSGGPQETVAEGKTGIFFDELTVESLVDAIKKFQKVSFDRQKIYTHAQKFSKPRFQKEIRQFIQKVSKK